MPTIGVVAGRSKRSTILSMEFALWLTDFLDQLETRIAVRGPLECWAWVGDGTRTEADIEKFVAQISHSGVKMRVPRVVLAAIHGPSFLLKKIHKANACHTCDNHWCVRPDHLFLGSQKENMADMWRKGRARGGTKIYR